MSRQSLRLCIAPDHPALAGHFPGFPVVPGVVLLDETLHAIDGELAAEHSEPHSGAADATPASLWHIGTVKFHRTVRAGEALQLEYDLQPDGRARFELRAADALVASGTIERRPIAPLQALSTP
jgi:3-hydroxymyristoyl/3-hydroxydecanoyl-(acyl carrier protein) dehydratase